MNLLRAEWGQLDSHELRILLNERIGGPGQYDSQATEPDRFYLPLARENCRVVLKYRDRRIASIEPGSAFDSAEWERIAEEIEISVLTGPTKVGRDFSFCSFRVQGSWRGERSGVQILPPPPDAPSAEVEMAEHPFVLEFPLQVTRLWPITNHRRLREHRNLTLLLNTLLAGRTNLQVRRSDHFWACIHRDAGDPEIRWVQNSYHAKLGNCVLDSPSSLTTERIEEIEPERYYTEVIGVDGLGLRVPADLDDSICLYQQLPPAQKKKFDRAVFWLDFASRQWHVSVSASFAALVSGIESLTDRGQIHRFKCPVCQDFCQHEIPGATERFRAFLEQYAPGPSMKKRRTAMYALRSGILHGSELMTIDEDIAFGWDPPWWSERQLHEELSGLTRIAMRNWLKDWFDAKASSQ